ncbi:TPA: hypothetical protein IAC10_09590 [Candidatus Scatousia excrementigallinarum]|uniref:Uncharacterized protein n=1 Tax=Candidatus Scatousia excrementigallinarum TaxID=2840935 RepID=A0A9D1JP42_9BACT|nr:hypothetical protein [Candidatus Scatousia excrementigallinarum]
MNISAVSNRCPKPCPNFTHNNEKHYENPINRNTERGLTVLQSVGTSALVGGTAFGIASFLIPKTTKMRMGKAGIIGGVLGAVSLLLTLPANLYNTKVRAFTREKEMDVFSRDRELKSNILSEVDKEVQDEDVSLDKKIDHYATVQMANNGNAMMIKGA